ncbi:hypothetical protein HDU87_006866 [Geranomyces variabilis]|uniref:RGS domain-containing protein n=1 Tax=Geranomyces variabilis TaxID=109894 RepID=A0AAD5TQH4_9FUNG|nr:hypothetical protein HDU87_006866 [Geranomyces variabilis]
MATPFDPDFDSAFSENEWTALRTTYLTACVLHAIWWLTSLFLFIRRRHHRRIAHCGTFLTVTGAVCGFFGGSDFVLHIVTRRWPCFATLWALSFGWSCWTVSAFLRSMLVVCRYENSLNKLRMFDTSNRVTEPRPLSVRVHTKKTASSSVPGIVAPSKADWPSASLPSKADWPSASLPSKADWPNASPHFSSAHVAAAAEQPPHISSLLIPSVEKYPPPPASPARSTTPLVGKAGGGAAHFSEITDPAWHAGPPPPPSSSSNHSQLASQNTHTRVRGSSTASSISASILPLTAVRERRVNMMLAASILVFTVWTGLAQTFTVRARFYPVIDWCTLAPTARPYLAWEFIPAVITVFAYLFIAIPIAYHKLGKVRDTYYIRKGLMITFTTVYICVFTYFIWMYLIQRQWPVIAVVFPDTLWLIIAGTVNHATAVFWPVVLSYREDHARNAAPPSSGPAVCSPTASTMIDFDAPICLAEFSGVEKGIPTAAKSLTRTMESFRCVLNDPDLFEAFKNVAVEDFNVENPLFYEEHHAFAESVRMFRTYQATLNPSSSSSSSNSVQEHPSFLQPPEPSLRRRSGPIPLPSATTTTSAATTISTAAAAAAANLTATTSTDTTPLPPWLRLRARSIYGNFIAPGAPLLLNLSARVREPVIRAFVSSSEEPPGGDVFAAVLDEVIWTMFENTFVKFLERYGRA